MISTLNIQHLESLNDVVERITGSGRRKRFPTRSCAGPTDRARRPDAGGAPQPARPRRRLRGRQDRRRARQLLPPRQPRRPARARPALGRRPRRGGRSMTTWPRTASPTPGRRASASSSGLGPPSPTRSSIRRAAPDRGQRSRRSARRPRALRARTADRRRSGDRSRRRGGWSPTSAASLHEIAGGEVAASLLDFARSEHATQLVLGASSRSRLAELVRGSIINDVNRASGPIDVHIISELRPSLPLPGRGRRRAMASRPFRRREGSRCRPPVARPAAPPAPAPARRAAILSAGLPLSPWRCSRCARRSAWPRSRLPTWDSSSCSRSSAAGAGRSGAAWHRPLPQLLLHRAAVHVCASTNRR